MYVFSPNVLPYEIFSIIESQNVNVKWFVESQVGISFYRRLNNVNVKYFNNSQRRDHFSNTYKL